MNQSNSHPELSQSKHIHISILRFNVSSSFTVPYLSIRRLLTSFCVELHTSFVILVHRIYSILIPWVDFWKNHIPKDSSTEVSILSSALHMQIPYDFNQHWRAKTFSSANVKCEENAVFIKQSFSIIPSNRECNSDKRVKRRIHFFKLQSWNILRDVCISRT